MAQSEGLKILVSIFKKLGVILAVCSVYDKL